MAVRGCRPSWRWHQERAPPGGPSSRENVAVQRIEGAAALLRSGRLRKRRRRAKYFAQARASRSFLLLLRHRADLFLHILGILVAILQRVRCLRRISALRGVGFDIFDHLDFGLAEIADHLAGFIRGGMPFAGGLDQLASLLRVFAQGYESPHAFVRRTCLRGSSWAALELRAGDRRSTVCRKRTGSGTDGSGWGCAVHRWKSRIVGLDSLTRQRRRKRALRKALAGISANHGDGQRHNQAADNQDGCSGKVQWSPNASSGSKRDSR